MKRQTLMLVMLFSILSISAQTIQNKSKWFDGEVLWTATVSGNSVEMAGMSATRDEYMFSLIKDTRNTGEYIISDKNTEHLASRLRAKVGWRMKYVRQDGMYFMTVRNDANEPVWLMILTPDNLRNSIRQQNSILMDNDPELTSNCMLNIPYFRTFADEGLRLVRNEILARHGYRFTSPDLKEHFESQSWYHPVDDNSSIKLNIIEQTNIAMIKSEEAYRRSQKENKVGASVVKVSNELDFLKALKSNTTIVVKSGVTLNFSSLIKTRNLLNEYGIKWVEELYPEEQQVQPGVYSEEVFDGRQITLAGVSNITIRGEENSAIIVDPRYAFTLRFISCKNVKIEKLTMGHTAGGYCMGGVVGLYGCEGISINNCDLFGCGTYGIEATLTSGLVMKNSIIRDCSYGIMLLNGLTNSRFEFCDFMRNQSGISSRDNCKGLKFSDCRFTQNGTQSLMLPKAVYTRCEIHNPDEEGMLDGNPMLKDCKLIKDDVPLTPRTTPITE